MRHLQFAVVVVVVLLLFCTSVCSAQRPLWFGKFASTYITEEDRVQMEEVLAAPTKRFGFSPPTLEQIQKVRASEALSSGITPKANWVKSGTVAQYNGMKLEPYVSVPILFNIVFIGFESDGHHGLKISEEQLRQWFGHLEHKMEHIRINPDESTNSGSRSHVYYDYHYRVIEFHSDVNTVLEAIIWDNARPENPWAQSAEDPDAVTYFVDSTAITDVLDTITDSLQLDESYTLFVMNPKLPQAGFKYGYRYGFSAAEMKRLRDSLGLVMELQKRDPPRPLPDFPDIFLTEAEDHRKALNHSSPFSLRSLRNESREWAELYMLQMHELSYWKRHPLEEVVGENNNNKQDDSAPPPPRDMLFEATATKLLQSKSPSDKAYISSILSSSPPPPSCLSDIFISDKRYAFIDLSAGPFHWGPIVGGEGVRTFRSLPNVGEISVAMRDFTAGGKWNDTAYVHNIEKMFRKNGIEILQKEKDILLRFLDENCSGNQDSEGEIKTCKTLRHKLSAVESYVSKHSSAEDRKTVDPKVVQHLSLVAGGPHEGPQEALVLQSFFAKLGNIVRNFQRHVVTPPLSSAPAPYSSHVRFHLYFIRNHNEYDPLDKENFDFSEFKRQMEELALPRQKFEFVVSSHSLSDDFGLAMAYSRSLKSAMVGGLRVSGQFLSSKRLYLDSITLEEHLRGMHAHFQEAEPELWRDSSSSTTSTRTVPIFVFSLDFPLPVLIDKYHQAKSMSDMVLAVQSEDTDWESHIGCSNKHVKWNLKNPLKAILSATAQHLSGVLPMHRGINEATGHNEMNWLWAVGTSPLSSTCSAIGNFSQFTIDAAQRSYVVNEMSETLAIVNRAVKRLQESKTGAGSEKIYSIIPNDKLVQAHIAVKQNLAQIALHFRLLDYTGAIPIVHTAKRSANHMLSMANDVFSYLSIDHCLRGDIGKGRVQDTIDWSLWTVMALAILSVLAYWTYRPRRHKPKVF